MASLSSSAFVIVVLFSLVYAAPRGNSEVTQLQLQGPGCRCNDFMYKETVGQCKTTMSSMGGGLICFVDLPSTCTDLEELDDDPGQGISAEACKNTPGSTWVVAGFTEAFNPADEDGDGKWSADEIKKGLKSAGTTDAGSLYLGTLKLLSQFDTDGDTKTLTLDEYIRMMKQIHNVDEDTSSREDYQKAFNALDEDGDGKIQYGDASTINLDEYIKMEKRKKNVEDVEDFCFSPNTDYPGRRKTSGCKVFTWSSSNQRCYLKSSKSTGIHEEGAISGPNLASGPTSCNEIRKHRKLFNALDLDWNYKLTSVEMKPLDMDAASSAEFFAKADMDGDTSTLSWYEYRKIMLHEDDDEEVQEHRELFNLMDQDGDGKLTTSDMKEFLKASSPEDTDEEVDDKVAELFPMADTDGHPSTMNWDEYRRIMMHEYENEGSSDNSLSYAILDVLQDLSDQQYGRRNRGWNRG